MTGRHLALIVEDSKPTAEDLAEILRSLECESVIVDNKHEALAVLESQQICFVLLDLEVRHDRESIRGHIEHGNSLLRDIRKKYPEHPGLSFWLPVIIVSGFAREGPVAVNIMRDGASDFIYKPFDPQDVSSRVRGALERSGRPTHNLCAEKPSPQIVDLAKGIVLAIPGESVGRRTRVMVGSRSVNLTNSCLRTLLHLMVARASGGGVHKLTLGATDEGGFKGVSVLRAELRNALGDGVNIIANDYHGTYELVDAVTIGDCNTEKLTEINDREITELAKKLRQQCGTPPKV